MTHKEVLELAQVELRAMYKRLGINGSNVIALIDESLRQSPVIKSLPEYNEILYHAKTLTDVQFREYWNEIQDNVL